MFEKSFNFCAVMFTAAIICGVFALGFLFYQKKSESDTLNDAYVAIENDYAIFYDGEQVDPECVNLDFYQIKIDDAKQVIYLTAKKKSENDYVPMPIIIP